MAKVLVVDDSSTQRLAWVMQFTKCAIVEPKTAKNGLEAIELIKENTFDVLVTDVDMPEMNGLDLVDNIRKFNKTLMIIVCSSIPHTELSLKFKRYPNVYVFNKTDRNAAIYSVFQKLRMTCPNTERCKVPCKDSV